MGNRKKATKAKKKNRSSVLRRKGESQPKVHKCECDLKPYEDTRVIISSNAIQNLIDTVNSHSRSCTQSITLMDVTSAFVKMHCRGCCSEILIRKDPDDHHQLPINDAIVAGAYHAGIGYTSIKLLFACMEIPMIGRITYQNAEIRMEKLLSKGMNDEFRQNGEQEKQLAIEAGDVITVGDKTYPFITVTVDAGWAKRSYGHSYNSNAGIAVIIGTRTQKILYMDTRIKQCVICDKATANDNENDEVITKPHTCYKNWNESSQAMEADIIVKGFQVSLEDHGLIYKYVIGDADSSVFSRIQGQVVIPGRIPVNKIDCINHAVRGLNSKIYSLVNNTVYKKEDRDMLSKYINRFGKDVKAAVRYNNENQNNVDGKTSAKTLSEDIINILAHIYNNHTNCKSYFCKSDHTTSEEFEAFRKTPIFKELNIAFHRLANRSHRIIFNTTSNFAECFMAIMTKCIAGKRINFAQMGGYSRRSMAAVMAYDHGTFWITKLMEPLNDSPLPTLWSQAIQFFQRSKATGDNVRPKRGPFGKKKAKATSKKSGQDDYGLYALQGKMTDEELKLGVENLVASLQVTLDQQNTIEESTVGQTYNDLWKYERRNRLTASNAGKVFRLQDWTKNHCTLKSILYPADLSKNENITNGINLEPEAKSVYSMTQDVEVKECGLFVSLENGIFAASPDGLVEDDGIIEIKCINCPPEDVPKRSDKFLVPMVPI